MKSLCCELLFFLLFVNGDYSEAGLFDAFGTVIGIDSRINNDQGTNPLLPLGPPKNGNNNNMLPSTGFGNNFGSSGGSNNNFRFQFPINKNKDPESLESDLARKLNIGSELSPDELLAAEKFPGIKQLLDKLKELNRQKELERQKEINGSGNNGNGGFPDNNRIPNNNNGGNSNNNNNGGFPINNNNNGGRDKGNDNAVDVDENEVPNNADTKWLMLKKRKFLFQAKPVRPENEMVAEPEVVYYLN